MAAGEAKRASQEKIIDEVKKVMNSVFFQTKAKFEGSRKYDGKHVIATLLDTIKVGKVLSFSCTAVIKQL